MVLERIEVNIKNQFKIDGVVKLFLFDDDVKAYVNDYLLEEGESVYFEGNKGDNLRFKIKTNVNDKWVDSNVGFHNLSFVNISYITVYKKVSFEFNSIFNSYYLQFLTESNFNVLLKNLVYKLEYYLLYKTSDKKIKQIRQYCKSINSYDLEKYPSLGYFYGFCLTILNYLEKSNCSNFERTSSSYPHKSKYIDAGIKMAIGHINSPKDRKLSCSMYKDLIVNYSEEVSNYLDIDAITTFFEETPELDENKYYELSSLMDSGEQSKRNLAFSTDEKYFRKFSYSWMYYSLFFVDTNFNFLIVSESKEVASNLVKDFLSARQSFATLSNKKIPNNVRFFWIDGNEKTLFACARFYLAHYLLKKYSSSCYICDIDQVSLTNIEKYLDKLDESDDSVLLPITGSGFEILPWRNYLAGNIYLKNNSSGKKFIAKLVSYVYSGLKVKNNSWMLDQNATAYAQKFISVGDLNLVAKRGFSQFPELSKVLKKNDS